LPPVWLWADMIMTKNRISGAGIAAASFSIAAGRATPARN
jgi:hypothetical protein